MPSLVRPLRDEIARVSKRRLKPELKKLRDWNADLRLAVRELEDRVYGLEREVGRLRAGAVVHRLKQSGAGGRDLGKARPTAKMVRSMRKKLGISQETFARLLDVSTLSVFLWEHKKGRLALRTKTKRALLALSRMPVHEVRRLLNESL